ncbi:hypothetical protein Pres01_56700 [Metapseudomonas resinovorans]|nr:hypothetical protein Pres01_56700 [Pseudomonas resinovorans]
MCTCQSVKWTLGYGIEPPGPVVLNRDPAGVQLDRDHAPFSVQAGIAQEVVKRNGNQLRNGGDLHVFG